MTRRLQRNDDEFHSIPFCQILCPGFERLKAIFSVGKLERLAGKFNFPVGERSCIMILAAYVYTDHHHVIRYECDFRILIPKFFRTNFCICGFILLFCVILHMYLRQLFQLTVSQQIQLYPRYFLFLYFTQPPCL